VSYREVSDPQGRAWRVWDTYPQSGRIGAFPEAYSNGWVTFECEQDKRRLVPVPAGWFDLSDVDLLGLLDQAVPVPARSAAT
jgi:hypothetical protein